jgi:hypothetical protein
MPQPYCAAACRRCPHWVPSNTPAVLEDDRNHDASGRRIDDTARAITAGFDRSARSDRQRKWCDTVDTTDSGCCASL